MYAEYWKLTRRPFENTLDTAFLYQSSGHREALSRMSYAARQRKAGFLLVGDHGTGKTLLAKALVKDCAGEKFRFISFVNPRLEPLDFLKEINYQLEGQTGFTQPPTKVDYLRSITHCLERYHHNGIYTVIIIDEAQSIDRDSLLEEMRLLLNIQRDDSLLFTLILIGEKEFCERIERNPQLKQQIAICFKLPSLDKEATKAYIKHRLSVAGAEKEIFDPAAVNEIYALSRGIPRVINNICDLALLTGFIQQKEALVKDIISQVGKDLEINPVREFQI